MSDTLLYIQDNIPPIQNAPLELTEDSQLNELISLKSEYSKIYTDDDIYSQCSFSSFYSVTPIIMNNKMNEITPIKNNFENDSTKIQIFRISEFFSEEKEKTLHPLIINDINSTQDLSITLEEISVDTKNLYLNECEWSSERKIIENIFMMLLGTSSNMFIFESGVFKSCKIRVKHLTIESLTNFLCFFTQLATEIYNLSFIIQELKQDTNKYYQVFGHSLSVIFNEQREFIIKLYNFFIANGITQDQQLTLISFYIKLQPKLEEILIIHNIINESTIKVHSESFKTYILLSELFNFSENLYQIYPFILEKLFVDIFSLYVYDISLWISKGETNECFMIKEIYQNDEELIKYEIKNIWANDHYIKCIPNFIKRIENELLAVGNYSYILRLLQENKLNEKISEFNQQNFQLKIMNYVHKSIQNIQEIITIQNIINKSLIEEILIPYTDYDSLIFYILRENFQVLEYLVMLRKVYLLEDINFLDVFQDFFLESGREQSYHSLVIKINDFFCENKPFNNFSCTCIPEANSIEHICINFNLPFVFNFFFEDDLIKYSKIMHFLLKIKYTSILIKRLTIIKDIIFIRKKILHFIDNLEFFFFVNIILINERKLQKRISTINGIYSLKNIHKQFINKIYKKMLFNERDNIVYNNIIEMLNSIIEFCINYSQECSKDVFMIFSLKFEKNFERIIRCFKKNEYQKFNSNCNVDDLLYTFCCFNSFYWRIAILKYNMFLLLNSFI